MFRNYLKIALRNFWKHKFNSLVNLLGLTMGVAGCLLIGLYVWDEWQYDRFVPDADRIYRVYDERIAEDGSGLLAVTPPVFAATMKADFPEVGQTLRLLNVYGDKLFVYGDQRYMESGGIYAEPAVIDFFGLELRSGDPATALQEPNSALLTTSLAKKYFGDVNPIGKTITMNDREVEVTGVLADLPEHFHLDFNYVLSFSTIERMVSEERMNSWVWQQFFTYLKVSENADAGALEAKLPAFAERHAWPQTEPRGFKYIPHLQNLTDIHLHSSDFGWDIARRGSITAVRTLAAVGLFLLLIAIINFVNLSTARAENRAREVGVRKVSGAQRGQLILQFISEAILLSFMAVFLAVQLTRLLLPALNEFTGKALAFEPATEPGPLLLLAGMGLIVGLLAGSYPGFVLSSFRPIQVLRQQPLDDAGQGQWLRKGLVVLQFSLTVILLIGSLIIFQQVRYVSNKDLGFQREHLLTFPMRGDMEERYETVKEAFREHPGVLSASATYGIPGDIVAGDDIIVPGREGSQPANVFTVDHDYIETLGLDVIAGRGFSRDYATDAGEAFVINETAVRELGLGTPEEAVGKRLHWNMWGQDSLKKGRIIGVVRDFHYNSLHQKIGTAVLHIYPDAFWKIVLRLRGEDLAETIAFVEQTWDRFDTGYPLEYQFVDKSFGAMYESEVKLSQLLILFTVLTIFVACLGLLGLAIFAAEKRTKEIGIRKILGASVANIMALLAGDFLRLILIAVVIAVPVGWYFSRQWLENFSYHVPIEPWVFLLAGALAVLIALLTVSFHSVRAASRNPVEALRYE
jgi:putative ABC transport system permease protein